MRRASLSVALLVLVGCASTAGLEASSIRLTSPSGETTWSDSIAVGSTQLASALWITGVASPSVGGLLRPAVTLKSREQDTLALQYRWTWFDQQGLEVGSSSQPWQALTMYGNQTLSVQGLAPNSSVEGFKLHVRFQE